MMKTKLIILVTFFSFSCSVISLYEFHPVKRNPDLLYGDWKFYEVNDEFDGISYVSVVKSIDNKGRLRVFTNINENNHIVMYENGDNYICSLGTTNVEHIFKSSSGSTYRYDVGFLISKDNTALGIKNLGAEPNKYIYNLNNYDSVIIRTIDSCGESLTREFNIKGTTHLLTREIQ